MRRDHRLTAATPDFAGLYRDPTWIDLALAPTDPHSSGIVSRGTAASTLLPRA